AASPACSRWKWVPNNAGTPASKLRWRASSTCSITASITASRFISGVSAAHDPASTVPPILPGTWLNTFREDMQSVLLAELDIRLHPAQGLMAALRAC
ncbi:MAG: DUF3348 family protein, partial [Comamonadaceae bacterium]